MCFSTGTMRCCFLFFAHVDGLTVLLGACQAYRNGFASWGFLFNIKSVGRLCGNHE